MQLWAATSLRAQVAEILDGRSGFLADACLRTPVVTVLQESKGLGSIFSLYVQIWHVQ